MNKKTITMKTEEDTRAFGLSLARILKPGDVIALSGDLGTGKTALTRYIAEGLGIFDEVTSPTFAIIKEYTGGRLPLYHFDVYRLAGEVDLFELGFEEYFYGQGVTVVEWADKIPTLLPETCFRIGIAHGEKDFERIYEIESDGRVDACIS